MKSLYLLVLVVFCVVAVVGQQDRHYSMFNESPMILNPGSAGLFSGDLQVFAGYRSQWGSIAPDMFKTISASLDAKVFEKKGSYFAAGLNLFNDKTGATQLNTGVYNINLSYGVEVARSQFLAIGVQPSIFQRSIIRSAEQWENQWTGSEFNEMYNSGEPSNVTSITKFDLNTGLYYYGQITDKFLLTCGAAVHHVATPNIGFYTSDKLYRKYLFNVAAEYGVKNSKIYLDPSAYAFFQGPNMSYAFGVDVKYMIKEQSHYTGYHNEQSYLVGVYYRASDSFYTKVGVNLSGASVGVAFDMNISSLSKATNGIGAMELFLRYRIGFEGKYNGFR